MHFNHSAPVLAIVIDPSDEAASVRPVSASVAGTIATIINGPIEAIELDGGSVLWLNESGKDMALSTNMLATKIAHRLHAGLFPDDTINGRAVIVGDEVGPTGDLVSGDVTSGTLQALQKIGVDIVPG